MKIIEAFDLPPKEDITALGFVVKLEEKSSEAKLHQLVSDYVLTPKVRDELPDLFRNLHHRFERGEDQGRFIHGSFGSGKSHFLSMLGLLLEGSELAWQKDDATLRALAREHLDWIRRANFLVVRVHMLTGGQGVTFDRALYDAFNRALAQHSQPPFHFLHVDAILDEARDQARRFGSAFWQQLDDAGIVPGAEEFERLARGSPEDRERLARAYLDFLKRDPVTAGLNPNWADGLHKLAAHAKSLGHGGVVFLVDELLLWLSEKDRKEFKAAIHQLNVMVDHNTGQRVVPLFAFIARQRRLKEFFPDMVDDEELEEHLDHHSQRFETTTLQDVELRHICRHRVLKRRNAAAVEATLQQVVEANQKLLPALLHNADAEYLRDVYPFHPALIETLIDVSALMQRERTALRLLYELLVVHNRDLELGKFIPVGRAFDALFPEEGFDASARGREQLSQIHRAWFQRFRPAIERLQVDGQPLAEDRRRTVEALVKTVLLGRVSSRLAQGGMSVDRLVRLNDVEVKGFSERGKLDKAFSDLRALARELPALQLTHPDDPRVCYVKVELEGANLGDVLDLARGRVNNKHALLRTFFNHLRDTLGTAQRKGYVERSATEASFLIDWRGTTRRVSLGFGNVRELGDASFAPQDGEEVRLLLDYPWDEPGFTLEKDRERARNVRRARGSLPTVCWLPRHFHESERQTLVDLAATLALREEEHQKALLGNLSAGDRERILDQAAHHAGVLRAALDEALLATYRDQGELESLQGASATLSVQETELPARMEAIARAVLDLRFNRHPTLGMEPKPGDLNALCGWLVRASESTDAWIPFEDTEARPLKHLGEPLELVQVGKEKAQLRRDGRFLKAVLDKCRDESVPWNPIDEQLGGPEYGFQPPVRNLLLAYVARAHSYRVVNASGEVVEPTIDKRALRDLTLQRAPLVTPAEWGRLRTLAKHLFTLEVPTHRTLHEQDRLLSRIQEAARHKHQTLKGLHEKLQKLAPTGTRRADELREALTRLGALLGHTTDSAAALQRFLSQWPDDANDVTPPVLRTADEVKAAVDELDQSSMGHLTQATGSPKAQTLIAKVRRMLGDGTLESRLTTGVIRELNLNMREAVSEILKEIDRSPRPGNGDGVKDMRPPAGQAEPEKNTLRLTHPVSATSSAGLDAYWKTLRAELEKLGGELEVEVHVRRKN